MRLGLVSGVRGFQSVSQWPSPSTMASSSSLFWLTSVWPHSWTLASSPEVSAWMVEWMPLMLGVTKQVSCVEQAGLGWSDGLKLQTAAAPQQHLSEARCTGSVPRLSRWDVLRPSNLILSKTKLHLKFKRAVYPSLPPGCSYKWKLQIEHKSLIVVWGLFILLRWIQWSCEV